MGELTFAKRLVAGLVPVVFIGSAHATLARNAPRGMLGECGRVRASERECESVCEREGACECVCERERERVRESERVRAFPGVARHGMLAVTTPSFSIPVICTTRRWIPASASTNQGRGKGDLVPL